MWNRIYMQNLSKETILHHCLSKAVLKSKDKQHPATKVDDYTNFISIGKEKVVTSDKVKQDLFYCAKQYRKKMEEFAITAQAAWDYYMSLN